MWVCCINSVTKGEILGNIGSGERESRKLEGIISWGGIADTVRGDNSTIESDIDWGITVEEEELGKELRETKITYFSISNSLYSLMP